MHDAAGSSRVLVAVNGESVDKYLCSMCKDVMKDPLLLGPCGHRTCRECAEAILLGSPPLCPSDGSTIHKEHVVQDKVLQKLLKHLHVKCFHVNDGCTWTGLYLDMLIHLQNCSYRDISCPMECGKNGIPMKLLKIHLENECPAALTECPRCRTNYKKSDGNVHATKTCPEILVTCPNKCDMTNEFPLKMLDQHLKEQCSNQISPCPFVKAGCSFEGNKSSIESHELECYEKHLKLVSIVMDKAYENNEEMSELLKFVAALKARAKVLSLQYEGQYFWKIGDFKTNFVKAQKVSHEEIKSQIFCSSKLGYRLQMSTSLYGRRTRQGEYMSMTVHLCSGEYDELLSWPFKHPVAVTLLDQCDQIKKRKHLRCFLDPVNYEEKNGHQVFGTETFAKIDDLFLEGHYIKNDSICLLVEILDNE